MYLDSTAVLALLLDQAEAPELARRIEEAKSPLIISPMSLLEAAVGLSNATGAPISKTQELVNEFLTLSKVQVTSITPEIGRRAAQAYEKHGKKASETGKLNMGDAMIYACAKAYRAPLLSTGGRFSGLDLS
jgi:ribonuclease VapC